MPPAVPVSGRRPSPAPYPRGSPARTARGTPAAAAPPAGSATRSRTHPPEPLLRPRRRALEPKPLARQRPAPGRGQGVVPPRQPRVRRLRPLGIRLRDEPRGHEPAEDPVERPGLRREVSIGLDFDPLLHGVAVQGTGGKRQQDVVLEVTHAEAWIKGA